MITQGLCEARSEIISIYQHGWEEGGMIWNESVTPARRIHLLLEKLRFNFAFWLLHWKNSILCYDTYVYFFILFHREQRKRLYESVLFSISRQGLKAQYLTPPPLHPTLTVVAPTGGCSRRHTRWNRGHGYGRERWELLGRAAERLRCDEEPGSTFQRPSLRGAQWQRWGLKTRRCAFTQSEL